MDSIWVKIAGAAVVVVVVIVVLGRFGGDGSSPETQPQDESGRATTVYDMFERDKQEFRVDSQQEQVPEPPIPTHQEAVAQTPPPEPRFEKLPFEQEVEAQRLHEMAVAERQRSRLPGMTPKLMVDYCREIIRRWPRSEYAYQARRMLADVPERYHRMYNITEQEMDVSSFYE